MVKSNDQIWHVPLTFVNSDEGSESAVAIKVAERKCAKKIKALGSKGNRKHQSILAAE
jgi:hypothetical protein